MNIQFHKITEDNFEDIVSMKVDKEQERFIASNYRSLAQAWLYYEDHDVYPFAIYDGSVPVGFMMLDEDTEERTMNIWRVMIDREHQGKGYGSAAIVKIVSLCRESGKYDTVTIDYVKGNDAARHVYEKAGFTDTNEECNGCEVIMSLSLR